MEKLLLPDCFDGSQETTSAEWNRWFCTFKNLLESIKGNPAPDQLKLLINHISPSVYNHISDCKTYLLWSYQSAEDCVCEAYKRNLRETSASYQEADEQWIRWSVSPLPEVVVKKLWI